MTKFEYAKLLGMRSKQISLNSPVMVTLVNGETDSMQIALEELRQGVLPFTVRRFYPSMKRYEDWSVGELTVRSELTILPREFERGREFGTSTRFF